MANNIGNNSNCSCEHVWCPENIINAPYTLGNGHICLVLNREVNVPAEVAQHLWQKAHLRCLVDGGANRWRSFLENHCKNVRLKPPELLTGDFDSLTKETAAFFNDTRTRQLHTPDQNATDFTKAIAVVQPMLQTAQLNDIIVFHETSGRFDQIMANINTLFKMQNDKLNVYLLSGNSLTWLLRPGKHLIQIPQQLVEQQRWCALIPIGSPSNAVSTSGLKWNLSNASMQFGEMVSTSNTYANNSVRVETDSSLIWSMGVFANKDD